ncbi:MAG: redox-regulated ATPase YchF [Candidatus Aenigmarchaeota archaeon]|nr:redox-regulated ATPase YchF [Candidatus Aenigmarchaeota archaeon]
MLQIGLVGCPNSGKSTFFKAATLKDVKIAPYPFTTIDPNEGLAHVRTLCPCKELHITCNHCTNGNRFVALKLWDVAGLVPNAHLGRGRGNAFLTDVMQSEGLIHILDASGSTDNEGNPSQQFDPSKNIAMLEQELEFWMVGLLKKDIKKVETGEEFSSVVLHRFSGLGITAAHVEQALNASTLEPKKKFFTDDELHNFIAHLRTIAKPMIIAANKADLARAEQNITSMKKTHEQTTIIPTTADFELALREAAKNGLIEYLSGDGTFTVKKPLNEKQQQALDYIKKYLEKYGSTGVQPALNTLVFDVLQMIVVYPVENEAKYTDKKGNVLPDAKLLKKGSTPLDLAAAVHEDLKQKFISAVNAKTKRTVSADYVLQHGDVISIKAGR